MASQLASTRRIALEIGGGAVALFFLLRVIADTVAGAGWLRWLTPLGWAEEMRPFAGPRPVVLLLPVAASALLLVLAARLGATRDLGSGLLPERGGGTSLRLLSSPAAQALREPAGQPDRVGRQLRGVRVHPRRGVQQRLLVRDPTGRGPSDRQARCGLDHDAVRLSRPDLLRLRARGQPVRLRPARGRPARGGRPATGDAARAAGRPHRLARRAAAARGRRRCGDRAADRPAHLGRSRGGRDHAGRSGRCWRPGRTACRWPRCSWVSRRWRTRSPRAPARRSATGCWS